MPLKNSQYNTIMRRYDLTRQAAAADRRQRLEAIYALVPGFSQLDEAIAAAAADHARAKISGPSAPRIFIPDFLRWKKKKLYF